MVEASPAGAVGGDVVVEAVPLRAGGAVAAGALGGGPVPGEAVQTTQQVEAGPGGMEETADAVATGASVVLKASRRVHRQAGGPLAARRGGARPGGRGGVLVVGTAGVEVATGAGTPVLVERRPIGEATGAFAAGRAVGAGVGPPLASRAATEGALPFVSRPMEAGGTDLSRAPVQVALGRLPSGAGGAGDQRILGLGGVMEAL